MTPGSRITLRRPPLFQVLRLPSLQLALREWDTKLEPFVVLLLLLLLS